MKNWEMIKELSENPKLHAKNTRAEEDWKFDEVYFVDNILCWGGNINYKFQVSTTYKDDEWEIIYS